MASLNQAKNLYVLIDTDGGLFGVYTVKRAALEAATNEHGLVLHVVPVGSLNEVLMADGYTPPSLPTVSYLTCDSLAESDFEPEAEEDVEEFDTEAYYREMALQESLALPTRRTPKVMTAKDRILAKLESDLGLADEDDEQEEEIPQLTHVAQARPQGPTGGTLNYREGGSASGGTSASVEAFSPV